MKLYLMDTPKALQEEEEEEEEGVEEEEEGKTKEIMGNPD